MSGSNGRRLGGLDLARGLAVIGMVAVNFGLLLSGEALKSATQDVWAKLLSVPAGDASATFVVLAGVGIGLRLRSSEKDLLRQRALHAELVRRALALVALGTVHFLVWPPDIIHLYGVMMLLSWPVLHVRRPLSMFSLGVVAVIGFVILLGVLDYEAGWNFRTLTYHDTTVTGHARRILFNGFHPVLPWIAFLWVGIAIGRGVDLARRAPHALAGGAGLSVLAAVLSRWAQQRTADPDLKALWGIESIPPGPLYMAFATGVAVSLIGAGLLLDRYPRSVTWLEPVRSLGRLALTVYFSHVAVGLVLLLFFAEGRAPSWIAALFTGLFSSGAVFVAHRVVSRGGQGPLERVVRWIARRPVSATS